MLTPLYASSAIVLTHFHGRLRRPLQRPAGAGLAGRASQSAATRTAGSLCALRALRSGPLALGAERPDPICLRQMAALRAARCG